MKDIYSIKTAAKAAQDDHNRMMIAAKIMAAMVTPNDILRKGVEKDIATWRRGAELEQPNPTVIGKAIDRLITHIENHNTSEPPPKPGKVVVVDEVIKDMKQRKADGIEKYGRPLETHNGRRALVDAYQEALDLCIYLKQHLLEL